MANDRLTKLNDLINRALRPTEKHDHEANAAAIRVCEILEKHPEMLRPSAPTGSGAPARPSSASAIHPAAAELREWRRMWMAKGLASVKASREDVCASCGGAIKAGASVVTRAVEDIATHDDCKSWWWNYTVISDDTDDVPF